MLFNSYEFIFIFLPLCVGIFLTLRLIQNVNILVLFFSATSIFFYCFWKIEYLPLLILLILLNYGLGWAVSIKKNIVFLTLGIFINILILFYYKYSNFIISNLQYFHKDYIEVQPIELPLAISFITFQQIAFLVDVYRSEVKFPNFKNYFLFISFFPQLIAGPIVHAKEMIPQYKKFMEFNSLNFMKGIFLFSIGLFKKTVIADSLAPIVHKGFDVLPQLSFFEAWVSSLCYTFQIYFDFSGYTDMALGTALLFNIKLPINFNSPYKSKNVQDFWRRWHITLGSFLRDYIYIPLGGNRSSRLYISRNLIVTFIIGGIWHGANWTFLIWGILHGAALVVSRFFSLRLNHYISWFITFNFINITWVFFRADDIKSAFKIIRSMFILNIRGDSLANLDVSYMCYMSLFLLFVLCLFFPNSSKIIDEFKPNFKSASFVGILLAIGFFGMNRISEFLYFNF